MRKVARIVLAMAVGVFAPVYFLDSDPNTVMVKGYICIGLTLLGLVLYGIADIRDDADNR